MSESNTGKSARRLRLEAELRENLKRRKEQARLRRDASASEDAPEDRLDQAPEPPDSAETPGAA